MPLYIMGSYESTCGGCDTIDSVHKVAELLEEVMDHPGPGLLVYEGLMISHMIGTVGGVAYRYGKRHTMAFLDTPLQVCLDRVQARRDARGATARFNPTNTIKDHANVLRCRKNAIHGGFHVVDLIHTDAVEQSMRILHELSTLSSAAHLDTRA
jgi:hypothetical protein